jgi:hypothetical protein
MHRKSIVLLITLLTLQSFVLVIHASSGEIDGVAVVTGVHDGDTFYIDREFHGSDTIRLADINASELEQPKSIEARNFLAGLVNQTTVYLDIDDNYIFDYHGIGDRLVCVAYVDYNATHYENVNKALVDAQLAEIKNFTDNEFNPSTWTLYVSKEEVVPEYSFLLVPIFMVATMAAATVYLRKCTR